MAQIDLEKVKKDNNWAHKSAREEEQEEDREEEETPLVMCNKCGTFFEENGVCSCQKKGGKKAKPKPKPEPVENEPEMETQKSTFFTEQADHMLLPGPDFVTIIIRGVTLRVTPGTRIVVTNQGVSIW